MTAARSVLAALLLLGLLAPARAGDEEAQQLLRKAYEHWKDPDPAEALRLAQETADAALATDHDLTICYGLAASMGAFLLSGGTKGKRLALPNARIMIHQPLGGAQGQAVDIEIQAKEILFLKDTLNGLMAEHTGQPLEKIAEDTDRDYFLSPAEAVQYGLIDRVVTDGSPV